MNMLGLAKRTHARFLLTSTSEVSALEERPPLTGGVLARLLKAPHACAA